MTENNKEKQISIWFWLGRVLPLLALVTICLVLIFDLNDYLDYILYAIAIIFAGFAFTWWWWVLDTVRGLFKLLESAQDRFTQVIKELTDIKKDLKKNANTRERKEPKGD